MEVVRAPALAMATERVVDMYRVISLRGKWPHVDTTLFHYVGRGWETLPAHPLANPFSDDANSLHKYLDWFNGLSGLDELLHDVRADTECGRLPLACWCGDWRPGERSIRCHAVLIAKTMATRYPEDMREGDW